MAGLFRHPPFLQPPPANPALLPAAVSQTILPAGIPSSCVLGAPTIPALQTLLPGGITSSCVLGAPTMVGAPQTIIASAILSSCVLGAPTIIGGAAQTLTAAGIPSSCVFGAPTIIGGTQTIIVAGIPSSCVFGIPTLVGGLGGVRVFIANIDRTNYLVPGGLSWPRYGGGGAGGGTGAATGGALTITQTAIGRASASFDFEVNDGSGYVPRASQICTVMENGVKRFSGCLKNVSSDPMPGQFTIMGFHIDAVDKSSICDNRVVIKTYPVGTDVQGMILDIVQNFLNGEGITTQGVNVTDTLDSAMVFNTVSVSAAFDQITALTGAQWWIDFNGVLHFLVIQTSPSAPFGLTTTSRNFRNFVSTETTIGYANKFVAVSNLTVLPAGASGQSTGGAISSSVGNDPGMGYNIGDTLTIVGGDGDAVLQVTAVSGVNSGVSGYTITNQGTGYTAVVDNPYPTAAITGTGTGFTIDVNSVTTQQNGPSGAARTETYHFVNKNGQPYQEAAFDHGLAPGYVWTALPIAALVSVTVNGTNIPIFPLSAGSPVEDSYIWWDIAQTEFIYPNPEVPLFVNIGDTIVVQYIPVFQNATVQTGTPITGTCGSGVVEGVIQVPNIDVQSQLDAIAMGYLQRNGTIPYLVSYETDEPGLFVGQQQSINLPIVGLASTTIYLTSVTMSIDTQNRGAASVSSYGSAFRYVIEANTQQNLGNWITWFERFISRTNYPLPVPRYEQAIFVLAPGGSLAGGTVNTNTYEAKNAGTIFAVSAQAQTAPAGQNLLLQFFINGIPLLNSPLVIPAGSTDTAYATASQIPAGATVFKGDLFTVQVSYQTLTLSPTPAGSVSFYCDWSY